VLIVLYLLAVVLVLFVAAVVATHDSAGLVDAPADRADVGLPDGVLQPEDLAEVRFGMVLRGYRMSEVDDTLARVGAELAARDARIRDLEQALAEVVEPHVAEAEARWSPPNTRPAPTVTTPSVVTAEELVVPEQQVVPVPSRVPTVVRPPDQGPAAVPTAVPPVLPQPVVEEPVAEEPVAEAPVVEEPVVEVPVVEEPVAVEPVVEEPVAEEPVVEEPSAPASQQESAPPDVARFEGFDDLFPEVLAPEPAAEGTVEATDVTGEEAPPTGDGAAEERP
jgi:DivIVA domain-containing protein